jgi:hypothetical protein
MDVSLRAMSKNFTPAPTVSPTPANLKVAAKTVAPAAPHPQRGLCSCKVLTEEIKNSQMRKSLETLAESLFTAPHYNNY